MSLDIQLLEVVGLGLRRRDPFLPIFSGQVGWRVLYSKVGAAV
jgi:hypothetical protein